MTLFKLFFQLVKSKRKSFFIYIFGFLIIFVLMLKFSQPASEMYQAYSYDIAVMDCDQSEASLLLQDYLRQENQLTDLNSTQEIEDAMFLRTIDFGIVIHKGFNEDNQAIELIYDEAMGRNGYQGQKMVDTYLQLIHVYRQLDRDAGYQDWHQKAVDMLLQETPVQMLSSTSTLQALDISASYFNTFGYVLLSMLIGIIGECVVMIFARSVYIRQQCAPIKSHVVVLSVFLGSLVLGFGIIAVMSAVIFYMQPELLDSLNGFLYITNVFSFGFAVVGLSLLVGMISSGNTDTNTDKNKITIASNVIALTCSFISGFFVPQWLIHPSILKAASLTPSYWYAKVNSLLSEKEFWNLQDAFEIIQAQGIILLFGVVFILMAYVMYQNKRQRQAL